MVTLIGFSLVCLLASALTVLSNKPLERALFVTLAVVSSAVVTISVVLLELQRH